MKIFCNSCNAVLSMDLTELEDFNAFNDEDGQDLIPQGFYFINGKKGTLFYQLTGPESMDVENFILVNLKSAFNIENHHELSRLNGCCGLDGLDGYNKVCKNQHEVGIEKSDCWMPHAVLFDPTKVTLK